MSSPVSVEDETVGDVCKRIGIPLEDLWTVARSANPTDESCFKSRNRLLGPETPEITQFFLDVDLADQNCRELRESLVRALSNLEVCLSSALPKNTPQEVVRLQHQELQTAVLDAADKLGHAMRAYASLLRETGSVVRNAFPDFNGNRVILEEGNVYDNDFPIVWIEGTRLCLIVP